MKHQVLGQGGCISAPSVTAMGLETKCSAIGSLIIVTTGTSHLLDNRVHVLQARYSTAAVELYCDCVNMRADLYATQSSCDNQSWDLAPVFPFCP